MMMQKEFYRYFYLLMSDLFGYYLCILCFIASPEVCYQNETGRSNASFYLSMLVNGFRSILFGDFLVLSTSLCLFSELAIVCEAFSFDLPLANILMLMKRIVGNPK
eukprot:c41049_g1_i1 orf=460-777(+)